ncbi:hypothetical protein ACLOJK_026165 [Asimina triloba]
MTRAAQPQLRSRPLPLPRPISKSTTIQSYLAFPPKPTRKSNRKNYLRPKLPISPTHPSPIPPTHPSPIPPETHLQEIPTAQDLFRWVKDAFRQETREDSAPHDGKKVFDPQTTAISSPSAFGSGNSFVGIGFHWFGLILVQTLFAVWFFGSSHVDGKSEGGNSAAGGSLPGAVDRSGIEEIGNLGVSDEPEFEKKVSEIRAMAKEARALEQKKSGNVGADSSSVVGAGDDGNAGEEGIASIKSDVRKEVDQRLMTLQKSLHPQREKSSKSSNSNARDGDWAFGRKLRPGISSTKDRNDPKPKGFGETKPGRRRSENGKGEQEMDSADDNNFGEEESHWLRDEVLERIVLKVLDNALARRDPFVGFGSEEELNFFQALDRKFKREGESAKQWMEKKLEGMDFGDGG